MLLSASILQSCIKQEDVLSILPWLTLVECPSLLAQKLFPLNQWLIVSSQQSI
jgi:hypothetical protein